MCRARHTQVHSPDHPHRSFLTLGMAGDTDVRLKQKLDCKMLYKPAKEPNDLEKYFVERANAGDVEGLVALYEPNAILSDGSGEIVVGTKQIREFFVKFLTDRPMLAPSNQTEDLCSGDLSLTSSKLSNGDITAEVARRQPDGNWLWVIDQFVLGKYK